MHYLLSALVIFASSAVLFFIHPYIPHYPLSILSIQTSISSIHNYFLQYIHVLPLSVHSFFLYLYIFFLCSYILLFSYTYILFFFSFYIFFLCMHTYVIPLSINSSIPTTIFSFFLHLYIVFCPYILSSIHTTVILLYIHFFLYSYVLLSSIHIYFYIHVSTLSFFLYPYIPFPLFITFFPYTYSFLLYP